MSEISSLTDSSDEGKKVVEEVVEAVEEVDKPAYSDEDLETLVGFMRGMIILFDYEDGDFNDEVAETIKLWLTDANNPLLFVFYDGNLLSASLSFPLCPINDLMYFMREPEQLFNVLERFHDDILFGTLHGDIEGSLLVLLEQVYGPMMLSNVDWSENVKANVINGFNAFLTYLSELHYKLSGFTLLYVPREGSDMEVQEVVLNRSMIKRLEAVIIDWTGKIRATLSDTQHFVPDDLVRPADEYSFWLYRHEVLSAIRMQYQGPNVQHIVKILELAQSLYIKHLRDVLADLDKEIEIAESNIPFLKLLVDPCFAIGTLETADDFCSQLIYVMHIIRFIGEDSSFLNKDESMTKLFLYLSNEIVSCCMLGIDVDCILAGAPRYGIDVCKMKINCCESYKIIYEEMLEHFKGEFTWNLDYAAIFNRINAFLQRLRDIVEVCDAMLIFGKYADGTAYTSYRFFCNNADEFERRCEQVEKVFHDALEKVESVGGTILDINNKDWYRYISGFRETLKSLDDIIENLLSNVFLLSENIEEKLNVLVTLLNFYKSESVRESFMRKIGEVWAMFNEEIVSLSKDISAGITEYPALLPPHAGRYAVLRMRFDHLTHLRTLIVNCRFFPEYPQQEEVLALYEACEKQVKGAMKGFNESWAKSIPPDMASWYQRNLICRSNLRPGLFEVNIERRLLVLFDEAHYFKILGAHVPPGLDLEKHEATRLTFDNVLRLVLYFNGVVSSISDKERLFFKPMIQQTERKLEPLRSKLTWEEDLSELIDGFVVNVRELLDLIELYKRENHKIADLAERIYGLIFVRLDLPQPASMAQLIESVTEQKKAVFTELLEVLREISKNIFTIYDSIGSNIRKMGSSWEQYIFKIDKLLKAAIFTCTLNTLRGVHAALENAHASPIMLIEILLKQEGAAYEPSVDAVEQTLRRLTEEVALTIKPVPSIAQRYQLDGGERSFYLQLLEHADYRQLCGQIDGTIEETVRLLTTYQAKWNVFRPFWCVDKTAFIERFKLSAMTSEAFQRNIKKFEELQNQLSTQGDLIVCRCVEIDALKLKYALTSHIAEWQSKYIDYLKCIAYGKIIEFNTLLKNNVAELSHEPTEVHELKRLEERYAACHEELPGKEQEIGVILKYFVVLEKYVLDLLPEAYELRHNIDPIWAQYRADLREIREQIDNYQDQFKLSLTGAADALKVDALEMLKMLREEMPINGDSSPTEAFEAIDRLMMQLEALERREQEIGQQLQLLGVGFGGLSAIREIRGKLEHLRLVWLFVGEWRTFVERIMDETYRTVDEIELRSLSTHFKQISESLAEGLVGDEECEVLSSALAAVAQFQVTAAIVCTMKSSFLQQRHWAKVKETTDCDGDLAADCSFRLLSDQLRVYLYEQQLMTLCYTARKEHELELELEAVALRVRSFELPIRRVVISGGHQFPALANPSEHAALLADTAVTVDRLRSSPYRGPFQARIDYWEQTVGLLEQLLGELLECESEYRTLFEFSRTVRRTGTLEQFNDEFDGQCFGAWCELMRHVSTARLAEDVCPVGKELLEELETVRRNIRAVAGRLTVFLEEQREQFPRFYLLSDRQLIAFLAHPTDTRALRQTLAIMYENVAGIAKGDQSGGALEAVITRDGEHIPLGRPLPTLGGTTETMILLDRGIRDALQDLLSRCHSALLHRGYFRRVESGWLHSWPVQLCLKSAELRNTLHTGNALVQCSLLGNRKPLKMLSSLHTKMLEELTNSARTSAMSEGRWERKKLNDLLIVELNARDLIDRLTGGAGHPGPQSFEWVSQLHSNWHPTSGKCFVQLLETRIPYGYECKRSIEPALLTPTCERARIGTLCALRSKQIPLLLGKPEASGGRHLFLESLAHSAGVFLRQVPCDSPADDDDAVLRMITTMRKIGGWLALEGLERILTSPVLTTIGNCLREIGSGVQRSTTVKDSTGFRTGSRFQLFALASSVTPASVVDRVDRTLYRPVYLLPADSAPVLAAWLWLEGFRHGARIAKLITLLITQIERLGGIKPGVFGLRNLKRVVERIALSDHDDHEWDAEKERFVGAMLLSDRMVEKVLLIRRSLEHPADRPLIVTGRPGSGKTGAIRVALEMMGYAAHRLVSSVLRKLTDPKSFDRPLFDAIISASLGCDTRKCLIFDSVPDGQEWITCAIRLARHDYMFQDLTHADHPGPPDRVKVIVECPEPGLETVTPSTVSHFALVHLGPTDLDWWQLLEVWLDGLEQSSSLRLRELVERHFRQLLAFRHTECRTVVNLSDVSIVRTFSKLCDALLSTFDPCKVDCRQDVVLTRLFFFCSVWAIGGSLEEEAARVRFDLLVREQHPEAGYPVRGSVYQCYVDLADGAWRSWETLELFGDLAHYRSPRTVAYEFVLRSLLKTGGPILVGSEMASGKTALLESILSERDPSTECWIRFALTKGTTVGQICSRLRSQSVKITKSRLYPRDRKRMVCFWDDLHVVGRTSPYGVAEFVRSFCEAPEWYEGPCRAGVPVTLEQCQTVVALRLQRCEGSSSVTLQSLMGKCHVLMLTHPTDDELGQIFTGLIRRCALGGTEPSPVFQLLAPATVDLVGRLMRRLPPSPSRPRYQFSLHTIATIVRSVCCLLDDDATTDRASILRLWTHECFRETWDRLERSDYRRFYELLNETISGYFEATLHGLWAGQNQNPLFADLLPGATRSDAGGGGKNPYVNIRDTDELIAYAEDKWSGVAFPKMRFIVHREAVEHAVKVLRSIRLGRRATILMGRPGSGRTVVCQLAAALSRSPTTFHRMSETVDGPDEIRKQFRALVPLCVRQRTVAVVNLDEIVDAEPPELLLELLNRIVAGERMEGLLCQQEDSQQEDWPSVDWPTVESNLHLVICLPSDGTAYRVLLQRYPSLVMSLTVNCVHDWTEDTLLEISKKYLLKNVLLSVPIRGAADSQDAHGKDDKPKTLRRRESLVQSTEERLQIATHDLLFRIHYAAQTEVTLPAAGGNRTIIVPCCWYFELLDTFERVLREKRVEIHARHRKFRIGIERIEDATEKVALLSAELEQRQAEIAAFQEQLDAFLGQIALQKREAADHTEEVSVKRLKIGAEETVCKELAEVAGVDLQRAMPALDAAVAALDSLNKKDMNEIKSYSRPPTKVELVMEAVMILLGKDPSWAESKRQLGEQKFLETLKSFDRNNIAERTLKTIGAYVRNPELEPDKVGTVSSAAKSLILWVRAIENYGKVYKYVGPKIRKMEQANASLLEKQQELAEAERKLQELADQLASLQAEYEVKMVEKQQLEETARQMASKLERARSLVDNLAGERVRWQATKDGLEAAHGRLIGDTLLAAGCLTYFGPLDAGTRLALLEQWTIDLQTIETIAFTSQFALTTFFYGEPDVLVRWHQNGLPPDDLSAENATILLNNCSRVPLVVDPQEEAQRWLIAELEGSPVKLVDFDDEICERTVVETFHEHTALVVENVNRGNVGDLGQLFTLQQSSSESCPKCRPTRSESDTKGHLMYLIAREPLPVMESMMKNLNQLSFVLGPEGLETKMLALLVQHENPSLEERKETLQGSILADQRTLAELEAQILRILTESRVPLLEDEELYAVLQSSRETFQSVSVALQQSELACQEIEASREVYRSCAARAGLLFLVLGDLQQFNPLYRYSLEWYRTLYLESLDRSGRIQLVAERKRRIDEYHTYSVFRNVCRGLFESDRKLFAFYLCARLLFAQDALNPREFRFLVFGAGRVDRHEQMENPCPGWLDAACWDQLTDLDRVPGFHGICVSFDELRDDWRHWFRSPVPEQTPLPGSWETNLKRFQKYLIVRSLRKDRLEQCMTELTKDTLGTRYVITASVNPLEDAFRESSARTLILLLVRDSSNPLPGVQRLGRSVNSILEHMTMSHGRLESFVELLERCVAHGSWLYVGDCHLSEPFLKQLPQVVVFLKRLHPQSQFRLWLSCQPHEAFPVSVLQSCIKLAYEEPKGIKHTMRHLYEELGEARFKKSSSALKEDGTQTHYKRLLFTIAFLHGLLAGRRNFQQLGWIEPCHFVNSDFSLAERLLAYALDKLPVAKVNGPGPRRLQRTSKVKPAKGGSSSENVSLANEFHGLRLAQHGGDGGGDGDEERQKHDPTPWQFIREVLLEICYGAHIVGGRWDRRVYEAHVEELFQPRLLSAVVSQNPFQPGSWFRLPRDGTYQTYVDFIASGQLPDADGIGVFGQHENANIKYLKSRSDYTLQMLGRVAKDLDPARGPRQHRPLRPESSPYEHTKQTIADLLSTLPVYLDYENALRIVGTTGGGVAPIGEALLAEARTYNATVARVQSEGNCLLGMLTGTGSGAMLDEPATGKWSLLLERIGRNRVPEGWQWAGSARTEAPLDEWLVELGERVRYFRRWTESGQLPVEFVLGRFTDPRRFLGAVLQHVANIHQSPLEDWGWEFTVFPTAKPLERIPIDEGFIARGLFLENGAWDWERQTLAVPGVLELCQPMPPIAFRSKKGRAVRGTSDGRLYHCPLYSHGQRGEDSFIVDIPLAVGEQQDERAWIKYNTALLLKE
ncbi:dynein axonemal heavy chain 2-like [Anopheles cruzii]|uniref:dynein axonemal heavy chain 2-like n=1 Tax=Anopheles cruzii TaxID=68878 RepID=UPI0022EC560B|nr:dynein axonemal heavy chain 2-like [Anopheles cruzii]